MCPCQASSREGFAERPNPRLNVPSYAGDLRFFNYRSKIGDTMSRFILAVCVGFSLLIASSAWAAPVKSTGGIAVRVGESRIFSSGVLRPGETIKCTYRGHTLYVTAPTGRREGNGAVWPVSPTKNLFHLNVNAKTGGYAVACGVGGVHW